MGCGQRGQGFRGDNPLLANPPISLSGFEPFSLFPISDYFPFLLFLEERNFSSSNWRDYNMANLVFKPGKISGETPELEMRNAWLDFYSLKA
jgi:hypothetical protein